VRMLKAVVALAGLAVPGMVCADDIGDLHRGLSYAKKACAECHSVEGERAVSPNIKAPNFNAIADSPGMTARALVVWLQSSHHATMPNFIIARDDLDNVVAYIMSLRAPE
jgi:mono/diheme cytochrome c family protein